MALNSTQADKLHKALTENYKERLEEIEKEKAEEQEESYERSFLHNAIYLHSLWFEQLSMSPPEGNKAPLLEEILEKRESNLGTFQEWMNSFAKDAFPNGWAIWGWSYPLKTFVGFPIKSHDTKVPLGVTPILVIDCWEHAYQMDFGLDTEKYLGLFWKNLNWTVIEERHQELATLLGFSIK